MDVQTYFFRRKNINAAGNPRSWTDHLLWHHAAHTIDLFQYQAGETISDCYAVQGPIHPQLNIAMDMGIVAKVPSGAMLTLSLSFNNDGPLGSFFRYICDNGTYKAFYDDLCDGKDNKIDVSKVDVSMDGIELEDREFIAAIREKREPNGSLAQVLPCMRVLGKLEQIIDPQRKAHACPNEQDHLGGRSHGSQTISHHRGARSSSAASPAPARSPQDTVKIGLILPMTGQQASTGKQIEAAVKLYMQQNGDTVAGKKIEVILKDDAAVPDNTKRLAQELIVNDKVNFIAGFGVTPCALAAAPLATQAKVPEIVMAAGTSIITERSPYIVRTSFTLAQSSVIIADWAAKNGIKKVVTHGVRLCAGRRRRVLVHGRVHQDGRAGPRKHPLPARQSGLSRRSCSAPRTPSRTRSSCSCRPARAAPSSSSSSSAASTRPASSSSARAT